MVLSRPSPLAGREARRVRRRPRRGARRRGCGRAPRSGLSRRPTTGEPAAHDGGHADTGTEAPEAAHPAGLAVSQDGYTLDLHTTVVEPARPAELELVIEGPDGAPLTDYEVEHDTGAAPRDRRPRPRRTTPTCIRQRDEHGTWRVSAAAAAARLLSGVRRLRAGGWRRCHPGCRPRRPRRVPRDRAAPAI